MKEVLPLSRRLRESYDLGAETALLYDQLHKLDPYEWDDRDQYVARVRDLHGAISRNDQAVRSRSLLERVVYTIGTLQQDSS